MSVAEQTARAPRRERALQNVKARGVGAVLLVAAICGLPVLLFAPFFSEPFMRDEGFYAASAAAMLDGQVPYVDFFDNKPPMIFVWYAASFLLFGHEVWAPRVMVALLTSLSVLLLYFNARLLFSSHGKAATAATVFALSIGLPQFGTNANTEYFMLLPMTANLLAYTLAWQTGKRGWYAAAGFAGGVAVLTKTIYGVPMIFLFFLALWHERETLGKTSWVKREIWNGPLLLFAGSLVPLAMVAAPLAAAGGLDDMIEALTYYSYIYSERVALDLKLTWASSSPIYLLAIAGPWFVLPVAGAIILFKNGERQLGWLLGGWMVANWLSIFAAGRFYDHYYVVLFPVFGLLAAPALSALVKNRNTAFGSAVIMAILPLLLFLPLSMALNAYVHATPQERHIAKLGDGELDVQSVKLADWIEENTGADDSIYNLGFISEIYFYTDRNSPSRFYFDHAFAADPDYEDEAIAELSADPPTYVLDSAVYERRTVINYYSVPVHNWVVENYDYLGRVEHADVYRLKGAE